MKHLINSLKKQRLLVIAALAYLVTAAINREVFIQGLFTTKDYLIEMLEVMPAVFVLTGLFNFWIPKEAVMKTFGSSSGFRGRLASVLLGSVSAGPIYAAFPITQALLKKGASVENVVIVISAWAVVKVPMILVETKFLGLRFALTRYAFTVPGILLLGWVCGKLIDRKEIPALAAETSSRE